MGSTRGAQVYAGPSAQGPTGLHCMYPGHSWSSAQATGVRTPGPGVRTSWCAKRALAGNGPWLRPPSQPQAHPDDNEVRLTARPGHKGPGFTPLPGTPGPEPGGWASPASLSPKGEPRGTEPGSLLAPSQEHTAPLLGLAVPWLLPLAPKRFFRLSPARHPHSYLQSNPAATMLEGQARSRQTQARSQRPRAGRSQEGQVRGGRAEAPSSPPRSLQDSGADASRSDGASKK